MDFNRLTAETDERQKKPWITPGVVADKGYPF
jgi:hypothetical protein